MISLTCGILKKGTGTPLAVHWLRLDASTAGGMSSIPGWGSKISHAVWHSQKVKKLKQMQKKINLIKKNFYQKILKRVQMNLSAKQK